MDSQELKRRQERERLARRQAHGVSTDSKASDEALARRADKHAAGLHVLMTKEGVLSRVELDALGQRAFDHELALLMLKARG